VVIFVAVFGAMFYSIFKHRKSVGHKAAHFHENTTVEVIWTIIPFVILLGMAYPATKTIIDMKDTSNPDLTIKATGYQRKWGYEYIKGEGSLKDVSDGITVYSRLATPMEQIYEKGVAKSENYLLEVDNEMVVPVNKKVRILTTANDVIHAFWVPAFGVKQDAIPGFVRDTWFRAEKTGDFYGQCAELCGKEHAYMPIHVRVVSETDYAAWVDTQRKAMEAAADDPNKTWELAGLMARGEKVYAANCAACHGAGGKGAGPIKALDGSAIVTGDADKTIAILLNGAANGAMPAWKQLSDTEIAAVITYIKNSWSNQTGKLVQPAEIVVSRD